MTDEPDRTKKEDEVKRATKYLHNRLIPKVATELKAFLRELQTKTPWLMKGGGCLQLSMMVDFIHSKGVNCRHMGLIRKHLKAEDADTIVLRNLLLLECAARAIKNLVRRVLRKEIAKQKSAAPEPYVKVVYKMLKPIFYYVQPYPRQFKLLGDDGNVSSLPTENTITNSGARARFVASFDIPENQRTFFFEVTLNSELSGKDNVWIGLVPTNGGGETPKVWSEKSGWFFNCKEGVFTTPDDSKPFTAASTDTAIGIFVDLKGKVRKNTANMSPTTTTTAPQNVDSSLLLTRNEFTLGDLTRLRITPNQGLRPVIILEGKVNITYNLGPPSFDSETTKFPVIKLCQALSAPKPIPEKVPSTDLLTRGQKVDSHTLWTSPMLIKDIIQQCFPDCLSPVEANSKYHIGEALNLEILLSRFSELSGVEFSESLKSYKLGSYLRVHFGDVISLNSRVSKISIMEEAEAKRALKSALLKKSHHNRSRVDANLKGGLVCIPTTCSHHK